MTSGGKGTSPGFPLFLRESSFPGMYPGCPLTTTTCRTVGSRTIIWHWSTLYDEAVTTDFDRIKLDPSIKGYRTKAGPRLPVMYNTLAREIPPCILQLFFRVCIIGGDERLTADEPSPFFPGSSSSAAPFKHASDFDFPSPWQGKIALPDSDQETVNTAQVQAKGLRVNISFPSRPTQIIDVLKYV